MTRVYGWRRTTFSARLVRPKLLQVAPPMRIANLPTELPPIGTAERWAWDYIHAPTLEAKFDASAVPVEWESRGVSYVVDAPSRVQLRPSNDRLKNVSAGALADPRRRAQVVHTFLHHELQAAELMCWALLKFADTPELFRRGLLRICQDEIRHMNMYASLLSDAGVSFGDFTVNDWFWSRVPSATSASEFLATMGVGFEGANLDHARRFAERFRSVGDDQGARVQDVVGEEEIHHVHFALHWLEQFSGATHFDAWRSHLPAPLSPMVMRGRPLNERDRARAGFSAEFVAALDKWESSPTGPNEARLVD